MYGIISVLDSTAVIIYLFLLSLGYMPLLNTSQHWALTTRYVNGSLVVPYFFKGFLVTFVFSALGMGVFYTL